MAEAHGNRTRRTTRERRPIGFEDQARHQPGTHFRRRSYSISAVLSRYMRRNSLPPGWPDGWKSASRTPGEYRRIRAQGGGEEVDDGADPGRVLQVAVDGDPQVPLDLVRTQDPLEARLSGC